MSYKVIRYPNGDVACFGPDTIEYQPMIPTGAALTIEPNLPPKTSADVDRDISNKAKETLGTLCMGLCVEMLSFLASLPGAPQTLKDAAILATAEKAKVKY